jgi:phosphoadenosine phosphosulfate reductase
MTDQQAVSECLEWGQITHIDQLQQWNQRFAELSATQRVTCALQTLPGNAVMTSSFGAQSAVSLHMLTQIRPDIPVVLIDTGYLFPETYHFIDTLTTRLDLNLQIYRSLRSPAWQESVHGPRWTDGLEGLEQYNHDNKVEPMQRALQELQVGTWFTGIRRSQAESRSDTPFLQNNGDYFKVAPLADWSDRDVFDYLKANDLPYHPLWEKGYVSIGDVHTTVPLHEVGSEEETRFFGLKRECGLHEVL